MKRFKPKLCINRWGWWIGEDQHGNIHGFGEVRKMSLLEALCRYWITLEGENTK